MGRRIVLTVALLLSICAGALSPATGALAQRADTGLQGNTYVDPVYGFTVEWDQDTLDAEEMLGDDDTPYGVYLTSDELLAIERGCGRQSKFSEALRRSEPGNRPSSVAT